MFNKLLLAEVDSLCESNWDLPQQEQNFHKIWFFSTNCFPICGHRLFVVRKEEKTDLVFYSCQNSSWRGQVRPDT